MIDTKVAASLVQTSTAVRLLGAEVTMVGITPEVAQSIVQLGIDLSRVRTCADLQSGVLTALSSLGLAIETRPRPS